MSNIKTRLQRLTTAKRMNREAEVICVKRSGKREIMKWFDATSAAIERDISVDHFEDTEDFKRCSELPNAILGVSSDTN